MSSTSPYRSPTIRMGWVKGSYRGSLFGAVAIAYLLAAGQIQAQPTVRSTSLSIRPEAKESFDVASIRQNKTDEKSTSLFPLGPGVAYANTGGHFRATNVALLYYISFAYTMSSNQEAFLEASGPSWLTSEMYDIDAKSANTQATKDDMRGMMRSLLAERFDLSMHEEARETPVYAVVLAKPGKGAPQLQPHPADRPCSPTSLGDGTKGSEPVFASVVGGGFPRSCGGIAESLTPHIQGCRRAGGRDISLDLLAKTLSRLGSLDLPAIDRTGLEGAFDFILEWKPNGDSNRPPEETASADRSMGVTDDSCPTFEQALDLQLGLKLTKVKGQTQLYVLDRVAHPTAN